MMQKTTDPKQPSSNRQVSSQENYQAFISWCEEFKVSILANKDATVQVVVGDHIKYVKLERS